MTRRLSTPEAGKSCFIKLVASFQKLIVYISPKRCFYHFGEYEASIKDARAALRVNPVSLAAIHSLGRALYSSGRFEYALVHFYRALRQE